MYNSHANDHTRANEHRRAVVTLAESKLKRRNRPSVSIDGIVSV